MGLGYMLKGSVVRVDDENGCRIYIKEDDFMSPWKLLHADPDSAIVNVSTRYLKDAGNLTVLYCA